MGRGKTWEGQRGRREAWEGKLEMAACRDRQGCGGISSDEARERLQGEGQEMEVNAYSDVRRGPVWDNIQNERRPTLPC